MATYGKYIMKKHIPGFFFKKLNILNILSEAMDTDTTDTEVLLYCYVLNKIYTAYNYWESSVYWLNFLLTVDCQL